MNKFYSSDISDYYIDNNVTPASNFNFGSNFKPAVNLPNQNINDDLINDRLIFPSLNKKQVAPILAPKDISFQSISSRGPVVEQFVPISSKGPVRDSGLGSSLFSNPSISVSNPLGSLVANNNRVLSAIPKESIISSTEVPKHPVIKKTVTKVVMSKPKTKISKKTNTNPKTTTTKITAYNIMDADKNLDGYGIEW